MAPRASRLADIGREGFVIVDRFHGGEKSGREPKRQYNIMQQHAPVPSDENGIDSKKAAEKYKGTLESIARRFL